MNSSNPKLPIPPSNRLHKSFNHVRSGSLIMKPKNGAIKSSTSMSKIPVYSPQILQKKPHTSRNSSVNNKSTSLILDKKNNLINSNVFEIRIRIFSNYGHPSLISCSEIDIINEQKQTVPISSITLEPKRNAVNKMICNSNDRLNLTKSRSANNLSSLYDFSKLTNGSIMEDNEYDYWHAAWPPEFPLKYVDLVLIVKSPSHIDSLRIWPNKFDPTQNFKHISIFLDQLLLYDNELENEFGLVIPLQKFDSKGNSRIIGSRNQINRISDDYGIYPVRAISNIEIDFLQAYRCIDQFGLQMIKFYDSKGDVIDLISNGLIQCIDCGDESVKTVKSVFTPKELDPTFKWIGQFHNDSKILIKFLDVTIVSAIMIVTLPETESPLDLAIKQIRIKCDGYNVWCGKIDRGEKNMEDSRERTNVIFLFDNSGFKEKIYEDAYVTTHTNAKRQK